MPQPSSTPRGRRPARDKEPEPETGPVPCSPCRATGKVFATREGEQVSVECPWCGGTGTMTPGFDAQAAAVFPGA